MDRHTIEEYKVPKKRYPLKPGAVARVVGKRGSFKIKRLDVFPEEKIVEALTWWTSGPRAVRAQYVTLRIEGPGAVRFSSISNT